MMAVNRSSVQCRLIFWLALILVHKVEGERHFFSYETVARSSDDGRKSFNEIRGSALDSERGSRSFQNTFVEPRFHQESNSIESKWSQTAASNSVLSYDSSSYKLTGKQMTPEQREAFEKNFMKQLASHGGLRRGFIRRSNIRPRTVESPALSVDSGGRKSASSTLANVISKAFNVEQGHYADIYDRIDNHKPLSTKRPAELIDETIEGVLVPPRRRDERRPTSGHRHRDD